MGIRKRPKTDAMVGKTYGRLTVLRVCKKLRGGCPQVVCKCACGRKRFYVQANSLNLGRTTSCGCKRADVGRLKPEERMRDMSGETDALIEALPRFYDKVVPGEASKFAPDFGPCLLWTGAVNQDGYGQLSVTTSTQITNVPATHLSWFYLHGVVPRLPLRHCCEVRNCVRAEHLYEGGQLVDRIDRKIKDAGGVVIDCLTDPWAADPRP